VGVEDCIWKDAAQWQSTLTDLRQASQRRTCQAWGGSAHTPCNRHAMCDFSADMHCVVYQHGRALKVGRGPGHVLLQDQVAVLVAGG
jgi:hypothetical protein